MSLFNTGFGGAPISTEIIKNQTEWQTNNLWRRYLKYLLKQCTSSKKHFSLNHYSWSTLPIFGNFTFSLKGKDSCKPLASPNYEHLSTSGKTSNLSCFTKWYLWDKVSSARTILVKLLHLFHYFWCFAGSHFLSFNISRI